VIVLTRGNKALRKRCDAIVKAAENNNKSQREYFLEEIKKDREKISKLEKLIFHICPPEKYSYILFELTGTVLTKSDAAILEAKPEKLLSPEHLTSDSLENILMQNETILAGIKEIKVGLKPKHLIPMQKTIVLTDPKVVQMLYEIKEGLKPKIKVLPPPDDGIPLEGYVPLDKRKHKRNK
jgi:hypothetical protein